MANMTRAEAICAAQNILDLAEELRESRGDRFPDNYYTSVTDQAQSMKERIVENAQYAHITENMDGWFRKTWAGLRKWDRRGDFNDELFYGLSDVILELEGSDGAHDAHETAEGLSANLEGDRSESESGSARDKGSALPIEGARRPRGRARGTRISQEVCAEPRVAAPAVRTQSSSVSRDTDTSTDTTTNTCATKEAMATSNMSNVSRAPSTARQAETAEHLPLERGEDNTSVLVARLLEDTVRLREARISVTLSQFVARGVRLIEKSVVHHADIGHILKKTTSDRTQQLLHAAFFAGKVAGIHDLCAEMVRALKEGGNK